MKYCNELFLVSKIALSPDGKNRVAETKGVHTGDGPKFTLGKSEPESLLATGDRILIQYDGSADDGRIVIIERNTDRFGSRPLWQEIWRSKRHPRNRPHC